MATEGWEVLPESNFNFSCCDNSCPFSCIKAALSNPRPFERRPGGGLRLRAEGQVPAWFPGPATL